MRVPNEKVRMICNNIIIIVIDHRRSIIIVDDYYTIVEHLRPIRGY